MKPEYIIVHHTGGTDANPLFDTSNQTFEVVNQYHKERFNFKSSMGLYLGYQYFIDKKGKLTQARKDTEEGAHTVGHNKDSIGICLAGNFDATLPTIEQMQTLGVLLNQKVKEYGIKRESIVPHRKFAGKTCYGNKLKDDWAQAFVPVPPVDKKAEIIKKLREIEALL